jgi:hypothetical protein
LTASEDYFWSRLVFALQERTMHNIFIHRRTILAALLASAATAMLFSAQLARAQDDPLAKPSRITKL